MRPSSNIPTLADATNVKEGTTNIESFEKLIDFKIKCNAAVPLDTATAYFVPTNEATLSSNISVYAPILKRPERRISTTISMSSCLI